ncbi:MAG TPA: glycoside hydrolase domain-containing protein [Tepidisphaeraceae bacterium]|nr:glycoside hydrolase domain-containing protein [Tepidisphaeraceae bacterium]
MKDAAALCVVIGVWASAVVAIAADVGAMPPRPYTPVVASADRFDCLGRSTTLGSFLLPEQITSAGKPLLAGPTRLVAEPDVFGGLAGRPAIASRQSDSATWTWAAESSDLHASATMTGDCDGFCWYQIRLEPKHPLTLRSLALELPRTAETSKYLLTARYTWSNTARGLAELGGKWSGTFVPYLWLGDEQRGVAWTAESAEGWRLDDARHALDVETHAGGVRVRIAFVDHEITFSKPLTLRWGLMASPTKPVSFAWRAAFRVVHDIQYESCLPGPNGRRAHV